MPSLLIHVLFTAATQSLINVTLLGQGINELSFYAAIISVLMDLDHSADGRRSSVHSLFTLTVFLLAGIVVLRVSPNLWLGVIVLSVVVGVGCHLALDLTDKDGIGLMPRWVGDPFGQIRMSMADRGGLPPVLVATVSGSVLLILALI